MARPAGIENYEGPADDAAFSEVIAEFSPRVQTLARSVRRLVYDVLPETVEVVWLRQGTVGWGTGPKKMSEQFAYLLPFEEHVTFGFYYGAELPDPANLFGGTSRNRGNMRSIKITDESQLESPELRDLVAAATRHRVPPPKKS